MSRAETGKMLRVQHPHCVRLSPGVCSIITQSRCFGCYELRPFRWQLAFLPKLGLDSYRSYCECVNDMSASIWLLLFHQFGMPALERACSPGQHSNPIRVIAFNTAERWSEDVSQDVAHELRRRCDLQARDIPFYLQDFTDKYEVRYHDVQLPLPMPGLLVVS